jgi:hypothetical protein
MSEHELTVQAVKAGDAQKSEAKTPVQKRAWETPKLEDVSEQVMAQPYIRFT